MNHWISLAFSKFHTTVVTALKIQNPFPIDLPRPSLSLCGMAALLDLDKGGLHS